MATTAIEALAARPPRRRYMVEITAAEYAILKEKAAEAEIPRTAYLKRLIERDLATWDDTALG